MDQVTVTNAEKIAKTGLPLMTIDLNDQKTREEFKQLQKMIYAQLIGGMALANPGQNLTATDHQKASKISFEAAGHLILNPNI